MSRTFKTNASSLLLLAGIIISASAIGFSQSEVRKFTLVVNGRSGTILVYRINGQTFVDVDALARIGHGSAKLEGSQLVLSIPAAFITTPASAAQPDEEMTRPFMAAALKDLALIKEWHTTIAHALQRGTPGNGSRLVVFHDRAAEGLHLANVEVLSQPDRDALRLLTNHFNQVDRWRHKIVDARRSMNTANYSMTPDALDRDSDYQAISNCSKFLSAMLPIGKYRDDGSCRSSP